MHDSSDSDSAAAHADAGTEAVRAVALAQLDEPADNPNRLPAAQFALLREAIARVGFLQPVLVREAGAGARPGRYEIVDGVHRVRAARELGLTHVPAVVADLDAPTARMVQVGMNRLRGELDLHHVARTVDELLGAGVPLEELALTGFSASELDDMVRMSQARDEDLFQGAVASPALDDPAAAAPPVDKPFVLELRFGTDADRKLAVRGLKKAAGGGRKPDLTAGLLRLVAGT